MRIIAGLRRGHKFDGPRDQSTRPTSDLVRESVFNILGEAIEGRLFIDLFAGTGAIGLEALSRGAARAVFVERNRDNVALIRRNVATLRFEDRATVLMADGYRWARGFQAGDAGPIALYIDPPYADYEDHPDRVHKLIAGQVAALPDGSLILAESRRKLDPKILPEIDLWDIRRYGGTQVAIRTLGEDPAESDDEDAEEPGEDGEGGDDD